MLKFIKTLIGSVKFNIALVKGEIMFPPTIVITTKVGGYNVFVQDDILYYKLGMPPTFPGACVFHDENLGDCYIVNNTFLSANEDYIECTMAHEQTHLINEDCKKANQFSIIKRIFVELDYEYKADEYAYDLVGSKYINFLMDLKKLGARHIDSRIMNILRYTTNQKGE